MAYAKRWEENRRSIKGIRRPRNKQGFKKQHDGVGLDPCTPFCEGCRQEREQIARLTLKPVSKTSVNTTRLP